MEKRNHAIDALKLVLAIFVVGIHTGVFTEYNQTLAYLLGNGIFRVAVPTFFIINGFYFQTTVQTRGIGWWLKRVALLYLVWMLVYRAFWWDPSNLKYTLLTVFVGSNHLWYVVALLFSGAVYYAAMRKWSGAMQLSIGVALFCMGVALQYLGNFQVFGNTSANVWVNTIYVYRNFLFAGLPFFTLGVYLRQSKKMEQITQKQSLFVLITGLVLLVAESFILLHFTHEGADLLLSLILLAPALFVWVQKQELRWHIPGKSMALLSSGIYLVHIWAMDKLERWWELAASPLFIFTTLFSACLALLLIGLNRYLKVVL